MKNKIYKFISGILLIVAIVLLSLLYNQGCPIGNGLVNFCIFEGRGLPLPYYNLYGIDWQLLLLDFVFWGLLVFIIIFIICFLKMLFTYFKKQD